MRLLILAFLIICCRSVYNVEGVGTEVPEKTICLSFHIQPLPVHRIKAYTFKEGPMKAVIFITKRGLKICADPEVKWVKAAVRSVNKNSTIRKGMV
ncbi:lymphotactin-like [Orycteropus afer afer]|uniref:Lymphotactin-like n=1 Tax=Orycteropus afer afer TaxID=1230840 RepID=A0A8B6ZJP6_ORYAF|nr:lymphotactin-like [Orycteropus afer afer]